MQSTASVIERIVISVHRRNGGTTKRLDFSLSLLDPQLLLDSLDLAEVIVAIEREFQCAPFDAEPPPRTWADTLRVITTVIRKRDTADNADSLSYAVFLME